MGTRFFTAEEVGAYLLLLCEQWDKGFVADDPATIQSIARVPVENIQRVLEKFQHRANKLTNRRLETERKKKREYSESQRDKANKRWGKNDAAALPEKCNGNTKGGNALQSSISISTSSSSSSSTSTSNRESKGTFVPPTLDEVKAYFKERGYTAEIATKAYDYYSTANWKDSNGRRIKDWKQKMISVWFKDEDKIPPYQPIQSFMVKLCPKR